MNLDKWLNTNINNNEYPCHKSYYNSDFYGLSDNKFKANTNGYHANTLFKQMIDYANCNNLCYKIYDPEKEDYVDCDLFDITIKDSFYKFCYDNSVKDIAFQNPTRPTPIKNIKKDIKK